MKNKWYALLALPVLATSVGLLPHSAVAAPNSPEKGTVIRGEGQSQKYYYGSDEKRYVFPTEGTFRSWYKDSSEVTIVSKEDLNKIPVGGNVTYRAGVKMLQFGGGTKVYAVAKGGELRWIETSEVAKELYGKNWIKSIAKLTDDRLGDYKMGADIKQAKDFDPEAETKADASIDIDKGLTK